MTQPEIRIGDAERESAVTALSEHYVAGRLTKDEYDERSSVAWRARTRSDLAPLFVDLPPVHPAGRAPASRLPQATRPATRGGTRFPLLPLIAILVGLAMLTDVWVVFVVVGVLWWTGVFRWLHRVTAGQHSRPHHRC
jgi:hypothetical protein